MKCSRCRTKRSPRWHDGPVGPICCTCWQALEQREQTILANMPLVNWILNRLARSGDRTRVLNLEREDAFGWAVEGLINAVDGYDPSKGSLASYAILRIRGSVIDASRRVDPLGRRARADVHRLNQAAAELAMEIGHSPSRAELADALDMTTEEVAQIERDADAGVVPLEALDWAAPTPRDSVEADEDVQELRRAMARLPARDGILLELRYRQGLSFRKIGGMLGLCESRVCGLHKRALRRLADALYEAA